MAFQKKKNRKSLPLASGMADLKSNITPISMDAMVLSFGGRPAYFKRLNYFGCPAPLTGKKGKMPESKVDMNRREFVADMYGLFSGFNLDSQTGYTNFRQLTYYINALDNHGRRIDFSEDNILWYMEHKRSQYLKGDIAKGSLGVARKFLSVLLVAMGDVALARKLPSIKKVSESAVPHKTLSDDDLVATGKKLMISYMAYSRIVLSGKTPSICPLFDAVELSSKGFTEDEISAFEFTAKMRVFNGDWRNLVTRLAFMIVSLWTGANLTPLGKLTRGDAIFKKGDGDNYEFDSVKARALYAEQKLGFGFVKRTKLFIENWLLVSDTFTSDKDAPLFPFFGNHGELNPGSCIYLNPHRAINNAIVPYGYPRINTSVLRKTRSSILLRAFGDIFVVADANRSSPETAAKSYLYGVEATHQIQLAGAFIAQESIAFGVSKKLAIENATYKFKDPLTEAEWLAKKKKIPNKTPTGMRCQDPFGERAKQSLIPVRDLHSSDTGACVDFLGCFGCEHHGLIAEKDDIWLMMSFRDSIIDTMSRPSLNSLPSTKLEKTLNTVGEIMKRFEQKAPAEYRAALELNKESSHPLYNDESALEDLLEVYAL